MSVDTRRIQGQAIWRFRSGGFVNARVPSHLSHDRGFDVETAALEEKGRGARKPEAQQEFIMENAIHANKMGYYL